MKNVTTPAPRIPFFSLDLYYEKNYTQDYYTFNFISKNFMEIVFSFIV